MKQRPRIYDTDAQKVLMWDRWEAGDTLHEIGKLFDRPHTSIHTILSASGGIRPSGRHRSRLALTMSEREEISRALAAGESIRCVARRLKRAASTISRELIRNGGKTGYRAAKADETAWERARRPKMCKLANNPVLAHIVAVKLQSRWSPEQIAGWLQRTYPDDKDLQVSHEAIFRTLFIQTRGALKKELLAHLRRTRSMRRSRHYTQETPIHGRIVDTAPISERPACIKDRAVPGHWEGDLLFGDAYSQIATLVERHTRYVMLVKLVDKDSYTVVAALARHAQTLPQELYRTFTWDRKWRGTSDSPWRQTSKSTSAIRRILGSAAPMKTRTDCFVSTFPKALTCLVTHKTAWMRLPGNSINAHAKRWDTGHLPRCSMMCCVDRLNSQPEA